MIHHPVYLVRVMVLGIERLQTNEGGQDVQCGDISLVANTGHFHNEIDSAGSEGLDGIKVHIIKPQVCRFVFPLGHGVSVPASALQQRCLPVAKEAR